MGDDTGSKLPLQFVDPRYLHDWKERSFLSQIQVMMRYNAYIISTLRAPMNAAGVKTMKSLLKDVIDSVKLHPESSKKAVSRCTLKKVVGVCVDCFAIEDFLNPEVGLCNGSYARDVLINGWDRFEMHGSCSENQLYSIMSHLDF